MSTPTPQQSAGAFRRIKDRVERDLRRQYAGELAEMPERQRHEYLESTARRYAREFCERAWPAGTGDDVKHLDVAYSVARELMMRHLPVDDQPTDPELRRMVAQEWLARR